MTLLDALASLWPVLTTLGGGYVALLIYIRRIMEERLADGVRTMDARLADKDRQIDELHRERDEFKGLALRSISATERVAESVRPILAQAGQP